MDEAALWKGETSLAGGRLEIPVGGLKRVICGAACFLPDSGVSWTDPFSIDKAKVSDPD